MKKILILIVAFFWALNFVLAGNRPKQIFTAAEHLFVVGGDGAGFQVDKFSLAGDRYFAASVSFGGGHLYGSALRDSAGNLIIVGSTEAKFPRYNAVAVMLDSTGQIVWQKSYDNGYSTALQSVVKIGDYLYALGRSTGSNGWDMYLLKINSANGQLIKSVRFDGPAHDFDDGMDLKTDDQYLYCLGSSEGTDSKSDYWLIKTTTDLDSLWSVPYNGAANEGDWANKLFLRNNAILVTGSSTGLNYNDIVTVAYNFNGEYLWENNFDGQGHFNDWPNKILVDNCNRIIIAGSGWGKYANSNNDFYLLALDESGQSLWSSEYGGSGLFTDECRDMIFTDDFDIAVAGYAGEFNIFGDRTTDAVVLMHNRHGQLVWQKKYDRSFAGGKHDDYGCALGFANNIIYMAGYSEGKDGGNFVIAYDSDTGSEFWQNINGQLVVSDLEIIKTQPNEFSLSQNYPNPFNPVTTIAFSLPEPSDVSLAIYNALGQEVAVLINDHRPAGEHRVEFNAGNLPSGVYFYRLTAGKFSAVNKMFLLK